MKSCERERTQLLQSLFKFFLTILCLGLFLSSPIWLPAIFSFLNIFTAMLKEPEVLFIVSIVIVAFLYGQSRKLSMSSPSCDIYEEYVRQSKGLQGEKTGENDQVVCKDMFEEREEGDDELDLLNRRIEDFIAKVNKQMRIEAKNDGLLKVEGMKDLIEGSKLTTILSNSIYDKMLDRSR